MLTMHLAELAMEQYHWLLFATHALDYTSSRLFYITNRSSATKFLATQLLIVGVFTNFVVSHVSIFDILIITGD